MTWLDGVWIDESYLEGRIFLMSLTRISEPVPQNIKMRKQAYFLSSKFYIQDLRNYNYCQVWPGLSVKHFTEIQSLHMDLLLLEMQMQSVLEQQRMLALCQAQLTDGLEFLDQLNSQIQNLELSLGKKAYSMDETFAQIESYAIGINHLYRRIDSKLKILQQTMADV